MKLSFIQNKIMYYVCRPAFAKATAGKQRKTCLSAIARRATAENCPAYADGRHIILEVKGQKTEKDEAKWTAAKEWVKAVNLHGEFGTWEFKVLKSPKDLFEAVK